MRQGRDRDPGICTPELQHMGTALLVLALACRRGMVVFDISPLRGELVALTAIGLWAVVALARIRRGGPQDPESQLEWSLGGIVAGVLLVPHVPALAVFLGVGAAVLSLVLAVAHPRHAARLFVHAVTARPALILSALALGGLAPGGPWDWVGLAALIAAACLLAWQIGRHLLRWAQGRLGPVR